VIRVLCRHSEENKLKGVPPNPSFDEVLQLTGNITLLDTNPRLKERALLMRALLVKILPKTLYGSEDELLNMICRVKFNSFGVWTKRLELDKGEEGD
jgi:hypothetical protein